MCGFRSLDFVRGYFQEFQNHDRDFVEDSLSAASAPSKSLKLFNSSKTDLCNPKEGCVELNAEATLPGSILTQNHSLPHRLIGLPDTIIYPTYSHSEHNIIPSQEFGKASKICVFSSDTSLRDKFPESRSRDKARNSLEETPSLVIHQSEARDSSEFSPRQPKDRQRYNLDDAGENLSASQVTEDSSCYSISEKHQEHSLLPSTSGVPRHSHLAVGGSSLGYISPLRETIGNALHCSGTEQLSIVLEKNRKPSKQILTATPRLLETTLISSTLNSRQKIFLSARLNFPENYHPSTPYQKTYRTPSSPELRGSFQAISLHQPIARFLSHGNLRHLHPDPQRGLYIAVINHNLFIPRKNFKPPIQVKVMYRAPERKENRVPAMTPDSITQPILVADQVSDAFSSSRRSLSTIANAGSGDTITSSYYGLDVLEGGLYAPNNSPVAETDEDNVRIFPLPRNYGYINLTRLCANVSGDSTTGAHNKSLSNASFKQVAVGNNPAAPDVSEKLLDALKNVSSSHSYIRCSGPCSPILTDHEEDYACWHPRKGLENRDGSSINCKTRDAQTQSPAPCLQNPASHCTIATRTKRSVSFADNPASIISADLSTSSRRSVSWSGTVNPSPVIEARLRGPLFSAKFEEDMLTLPMPPIEHVIPGGVRRHSVSTTSISRWEKPKSPTGLFYRLNKFFTGCFSSR